MPVITRSRTAASTTRCNAFKSFNVAFPGLVGNTGPTPLNGMLSDEDMTDFTNFILQVSYPPNPIRNLDNSLTADQQAATRFFFNRVELADGTTQELPSDRFHNCNGCHTLDAAGNAGKSPHPGFFGTDGRLSFEFESQIFKVPHLRNLYTKVGMFGSSPDTLQPGTIFLPEQQSAVADQIRGFGFQHDGDLGQLEHFFTGQVFLQTTDVGHARRRHGGAAEPVRHPVHRSATLGLPTPPVVQGDGGFAAARSDRRVPDGVRHQLRADRRPADHADLVQRDDGGRRASICSRRARPRASATSSPSRAASPASTRASSTAAAAGLAAVVDEPAADQRRAAARPGDQARPLPSLTFTCVPAGTGVRMALDRDGDGYADGDEVLHGTNPANPLSHP